MLHATNASMKAHKKGKNRLLQLIEKAHRKFTRLSVIWNKKTSFSFKLVTTLKTIIAIERKHKQNVQ